MRNKFVRWAMSQPNDTLGTEIFKSLLVAAVIGLLSGGLFALLFLGANCIEALG